MWGERYVHKLSAVTTDTGLTLYVQTLAPDEREVLSENVPSSYPALSCTNTFFFLTLREGGAFSVSFSHPIHYILVKFARLSLSLFPSLQF